MVTDFISQLQNFSVCILLKHQKSHLLNFIFNLKVNILPQSVKGGVFFFFLGFNLLFHFPPTGIPTTFQYLITIMNLLDLMNVQCTCPMSEDGRVVITALSQRNESLRTGHGHSIFTFFNQTGNQNL